MLYHALFYPCSYGFIPQTREEGEQNPIDVFILGNYSLTLCEFLWFLRPPVIV